MILGLKSGSTHKKEGESQDAFNITKKYNEADQESFRTAGSEIAEETMPTVDEWQDKLVSRR